MKTAMWCLIGFVLHAVAGVWGAHELWMAITREGGFLPGLTVAIFSPLIALVCGPGGTGAGYLASRDQIAGAAASACAVTCWWCSGCASSSTEADI